MAAFTAALLLLGAAKAEHAAKLAVASAVGNSSCAVPLNNTHLGGGDNLDESFATADWHACCARCDELPKCVAYTWNAAQPHINCWLKASINPGGAGGAVGSVSGRKDGMTPSPPPPPPPPHPVKNCSGRCPNILYLMADDMRPQLGAYGDPVVKTPNLDALAKDGLLFQYAYTQYAYCCPSRNSFLSGRRPERTQIMNFNSDFRRGVGKDWTALPEFFKDHGYFTTSAGKLYHDGMDDVLSWSYPSNQTHWIQCSHGDLIENMSFSNYCKVSSESEHPFTDEDMILHEGLLRLDMASKQPRPWFVGTGVHRPHHSSRLPDGFYGEQLYPIVNGLDPVQPPKHPLAPTGAPWMSGNWKEGDYRDPDHGCPDCAVPPVRSVEYRRWYYAATSYADHMLGQSLAKLQSLGAEVNAKTITLFHADHGYQLGELNEWSKKTDTELATRVPFIIRVPWEEASIGKSTPVKAELIDMYKTLVALSSLPAADIEEDVQGTSLAPVFADPTGALPTKKAYSQIGSCACQVYHVASRVPWPGSPLTDWSGKECGAGRCIHTPLNQFDFMGYSVRDENWRFTAWVPMNNGSNPARVDWQQEILYELYALHNDTGADFDFDGYSLNLASQPQHASLIAAKSKELEATVATWY